MAAALHAGAARMGGEAAGGGASQHVPAGHRAALPALAGGREACHRFWHGDESCEAFGPIEVARARRVGTARFDPGGSDPAQIASRPSSTRSKWLNHRKM